MIKLPLQPRYILQDGVGRVKRRQGYIVETRVEMYGLQVSGKVARLQSGLHLLLPPARQLQRILSALQLHPPLSPTDSFCILLVTVDQL